MPFEWKGVVPALTTPMTANDQIDVDLFEKQVDRQILAGAAGVIIGGSLGEASVITADEKELMVKAAQSVAGGKIPVLLNIAEGNTAIAVHQIQAAEKWGANGFMLLPPMRYRSDDRETVAYFTTLARATSLPVMIYNNPVDYKINVTLDMLEELSSCSNIGAIKESTRDVTNVTRLINRFGDRFSILCGVDTLALEELVTGAKGWVAGLVCAFPEETMAIYALVKAGRIQEALEIYRWFMPLLELDIHPKLVQYIKLAGQLSGYGTEWVRAPRLALQGEERAAISSIIQQALDTRPKLPEYHSLLDQ
ncbi:MAG: dihydrodipicolinate synthase family protein [Chitinophagaceae bacterium]|nr:dihydrodipicolinate synthase family protein [Chitinophagaceae bacterium]MCA6477154.1 dihydrodipicolinate synthase family protein [Chitinophagaceae bacterium]